MGSASLLPVRGGYEKIVTHNDFDGVVSGALCAWALGVDRLVFAGPLAIAKSQIMVTEHDVVCDLPYPVQCGLWFDHHEGNREELRYRGIDPLSIPGRFDLKPSCSRVVYEYFRERADVPSYFVKAVDEADVIDSFAYSSVSEWRSETPGKVVDWTLKMASPSSEDSFAYMRNLVQQLRDRPLDEVGNLPSVQRRLKQYYEEEGRMLKVIGDASFFLEQDREKEMVVVDLTPFQRRPHLIKNLAFLVHPEALAVAEVYTLLEQGVKSNHLGISVSLSIKANQQKGQKNVGEIMRLLNIGDGHPGAAGGTVRCKSKQEMLRKKKEILDQVFKLWSAQ